MKHLTYATIFVLMTMQPLMAANNSINTSCESINTEIQICANVAGCMADQENPDTCMACPAGKYGAGCTKSCTAQNTYDSGCDGCEWEYRNEGFMVDDCYWIANCPAGYYWSDDSGCQPCASDEFTPDKTEVEYWGEEIEITSQHYSCQTCGANSTGIKRDDISDSGGCQCKSGYHLPNSKPTNTETSTGAACVPATYRIRIYKNRPWIENDNEYITLYVRFNQTGFVTQGAPTDDNSRDSWFESASKTTTVPNVDDGKNNRYRINGYTDTPCDVNDCPEPILVPGDVYSAPITDFTRDTDLYACYNTTTYSIMYLSDAQSTGTYETDSFEYNTPLQSAMYVEDVYEHAPRFYERWDGKIFSHWSCYNSTCDDTEIHPGDPIPEPNAPYPQTQLIAVLKDCGTGKYCKNNEEDYCPAGTTTLITTATSEAACKLTNKTKFKDNTDLIFSLPISDSTTISIK